MRDDIEAGFDPTSAERMTVDLPASMAAQVRAAVEAGEYVSASDAVRHAVRLWSDRRQAEAHELDRLRQAWDAGKASGPYGPIDFDQLRREARDRLARHKTSNAG